MTIKELRVLTGLSQSKFAEKFNIPVKTIQNWEIGQRNPAPYIPDLIEKILRLEAELSENKMKGDNFE